MWAGATIPFLLGTLAGITAAFTGIGLNKLLVDIRGGISNIQDSIKAVATNQFNLHSQVQTQNAETLMRLNRIEKLVTPVIEIAVAPEPSDKLDNRNV